MFLEHPFSWSALLAIACSSICGRERIGLALTSQSGAELVRKKGGAMESGCATAIMGGNEGDSRRKTAKGSAFGELREILKV